MHKDEMEQKEINNLKMLQKIEGTIQRQKEEDKKAIVEEKIDIPEEPLNSEDDDEGFIIRRFFRSHNSKRSSCLL